MPGPGSLSPGTHAATAKPLTGGGQPPVRSQLPDLVHVQQVDPDITAARQGADDGAQRPGGTPAPADHLAQVVGVDPDLQDPAPAEPVTVDADIVGVIHDALDQVLKRLLEHLRPRRPARRLTPWRRPARSRQRGPRRWRSPRQPWPRQPWPACPWPACPWPACPWPACPWPACPWPACPWPRRPWPQNS